MISVALFAAVLLIGEHFPVSAQVPGQVSKRPNTYLSVIESMPWDPSRDGPMVAPCLPMIARGSTLAELDRKVVRLGGLSAIVPVEMTTINSSFTDPPNLYDGLSVEAKVLYLLSTLNSDQWSKASSVGIGFADCHGEQVAVMQSILPRPFRYDSIKVMGPRSFQFDDSHPTVLSDQERQQVRLKVGKRIDLTVYLENSGGTSGAEVRDSLKPGDRCAYLKEDENSLYGHQVLIHSPNTLKKSQLDLKSSRFDAMVKLVPTEDLPKLVARIEHATSTQILVDPHYKWMTMVERGEAASARELIRAIALGVTGTYRRVGDSYVLTSDLEGVGVHQARIAIWQDEIDKVIQEREDLWRSVIAKNGGLQRLHFSESAYDRLTQAERKNLEYNDRPDSREEPIKLDLCSDAIRKEVLEYQGGLKLDTSKVGLHSTARFEFVLPNGVSMSRNINWLGQTGQFSPNPYIWRPPKVTDQELPFSAQALRASIVLKAETPAAVQEAVERVKRLGQSDLWILTSQIDLLRSAIMAGQRMGVNVGLALRPWESEARNDVTDLDVTIQSDHGKSLNSKVQNNLSLGHFWQDIKAFQPVYRDQLSPMSQGLPVKWEHIRDLASVQGVHGVILLDAFPIGYAKATSNAFGSYFYSAASEVLLANGYSLPQRITWLHDHQTDPVDIEDQYLRTKVRTDLVWGGSWQSGDAVGAWQMDRGKWAEERIKGLLQSLAPAVSMIYLTGQPVKNHMPPSFQTALYRWKGSGDIPTNPEDFVGDDTAKLADMLVVSIQETDEGDARNRVASQLAKLSKQFGKPILLDLTDVPQSRIGATLKSWIKP